MILSLGNRKITHTLLIVTAQNQGSNFVMRTVKLIRTYDSIMDTERSGGIVGYGMDDRGKLGATEKKKKSVLLQRIQPGFRVHQASFSMETRGLFHRVNFRKFGTKHRGV